MKGKLANNHVCCLSNFLGSLRGYARDSPILPGVLIAGLGWTWLLSRVYGCSQLLGACETKLTWLVVVARCRFYSPWNIFAKADLYYYPRRLKNSCYSLFIVVIYVAWGHPAVLTNGCVRVCIVNLMKKLGPFYLPQQCLLGLAASFFS